MNYAVFICTHGRPYEQKTLEVLRKCGYTKDVYLVLDDEDDTYNDYLKYCDDKTLLVEFVKEYYVQSNDSGTNHPIRNTHLYAWNACENLAKESGFDYAIIVDDDLTGFRYRYEEDGHLKSQTITKNIDKLFEAYLEYMESTNISALSVADARNYIGGKAKNGRNMNTLVFRKVSDTIIWKSEMYEEMVTSLLAQQTGKFIFQPTFFQYETKNMAKNVKGGMEEIYNSKSIFNRSAYAVMFHPSCISFDANNTGFRLKKDNAFPKLIGSSCRRK